MAAPAARVLSQQDTAEMLSVTFCSRCFQHAKPRAGNQQKKKKKKACGVFISLKSWPSRLCRGGPAQPPAQPRRQGPCVINGHALVEMPKGERGADAGAAEAGEEGLCPARPWPPWAPLSSTLHLRGARKGGNAGDSFEKEWWRAHRGREGWPHPEGMPLSPELPSHQHPTWREWECPR